MTPATQQHSHAVHELESKQASTQSTPHLLHPIFTLRPEENTEAVDWQGKVALIQCAQAMGISRYIFFR